MPQIPFPRRRHPFDQAALQDLLSIFLRQFKRPLAERGIAMTDAECDDLAAAMVERSSDARLPPLRSALATLVRESEQVLAGFKLDFASALRTPADSLPGWETTAEFLDLASQKSNAELRITAGAVLLAVLGNRHALRLLLVRIDAADEEADNDSDDLDTATARRALIFATRVDADQPDALERARAWVEAAFTGDALPPSGVL